MATALTTILNRGKATDVVPSLTLILMLENVPAAVGVPASMPVLVLKVAHAGLPVIVNLKALPSASLADGWKAYAVATVAVVDGTPEMIGVVLAVGGSAGVVAAVT